MPSARRPATPGGRPPHVVLVVLGFPPSSGSGAYRGLGTANHLAALGWKVTVLTVAESFFDDVTGSRDDSLLDHVDPRVDVVRVPMRQDHLVGDVRKWGWLRGTFRQVHDDLWNLVQTRGFPERYAGWIPGLVRAALRTHRRDPVDVVLASGNPWSAFAAAWAVNRLSGIPYVLDYRDAWTLDMVTEQPGLPPEHIAWGWERRMVSSAARVVFVNEGLRQWHAQRYPDAADRMRVVHNGYDPEVTTFADWKPPTPGRTPRFGFVGTVTELHPHEQVWEGWRRARTGDLADAEFDIWGRLGFFARSRARIEALLPDPGTSGVVYRGPVPKLEVPEVYGKLDVLVLLVAGGRFITSGKIFESMAVGKPMVLACDPACDAVNVSRGHPLVHVAESLEPDALAAAFRSAAQQAATLTEADVEAARDYARRYERGRLVGLVDVELREVVAGG